MSVTKTKRCEYCGSNFVSTRVTHRFCTKNCQKENYKAFKDSGKKGITCHSDELEDEFNMLFSVITGREHILSLSEDDMSFLMGGPQQDINMLLDMGVL